jgi:tRNA U34 5-methylaminomethyl-2-thiouridine-forming methyltransferase MnmC
VFLEAFRSTGINYICNNFKVLERKIIKTADGSSSLYLPQWDENYHSRHGAIQEAYHVFIHSGLDLFKEGSEVSILEMGFGTGLNCFICFLESQKRDLQIEYVGLEGYPLDIELIKELKYPEALKALDMMTFYNQIIGSEWDTRVKISSGFELLKRHVMFEEFDGSQDFDLIYFDAFGARVQPELWTETIFAKMYVSLRPGGILVTYSAKGSVRRALQVVGFEVERLPGPPGKREMLRGRKL